MAASTPPVQSYRLAIIGAGPAGLSAAARAAHLDRTNSQQSAGHIVLESFSAHAKTIQRYQKGKLVMAEPSFLDLRSDLRFVAGSREQILSNWLDDYGACGVNIRFNSEVTKVTGNRGNFRLTLADGATIESEAVVLAIGLEGNPRRVGVAGDDLAAVQYQLDDPKAYADESILVVGAGDAAIENALALAEQNRVFIINRSKEFSRAKEGNLSAILAALSNPARSLKCSYETKIRSIVHIDGKPSKLSVTLETPSGTTVVECERIIARLGADPPRRFVESMGITFPNARPDAIPALDKHYQSDVPGIFVIGSLAGYPLIKQAMNQGYDVAEYLYGNETIKPVDQQLIEWQFSGIPFFKDPDEILEKFKSRAPMFQELNALAFRELIIESDISVSYHEGPDHDDELAKAAKLREWQVAQGRQPRATKIILEGAAIYEAGEYGTSFFTIVQGSVTLQTPGNASLTTRLKQGEFFGEMSLLSGRPRSERAVAGAACVLVETPRRTMIKLMNSNETVRSGIDWIFIVRELQRHFVPAAPSRSLRDIAGRVDIRRFKAGETVFVQGETGDSLYVVRSGGLTLYRRTTGSAELAVAQIPAGGLAGEMALMGDRERRETARATLASELIELKRGEFQELMKMTGASVETLQHDVSVRIKDNARTEVQPGAPPVMGFLMDQGLGEATDVLVIDEALCIGCDNCEKACAETHAGVSRLDRKAGATFAQLHIPVACRHCDQPHCMKDCPPNAIRRSASGEVYINDSCIGCGNCQTNCPYGVIRMVYEAPQKPSLLSWLLFGTGPGMGEHVGYTPTEAGKAKGKKAVKCDACIDEKSGPACVNACPTGAAIRISPAQYVDLLENPRK